MAGRTWLGATRGGAYGWGGAGASFDYIWGGGVEGWVLLERDEGVRIASEACPRCGTGALRGHEDGVFCVNCGTVFYASRPPSEVSTDLRKSREGTRWRRDS